MPYARNTRPRHQAAKDGNFDVALSKIEQIEKLAAEWRASLTAAKKESLNPTEPAAAPEPPAEKTPFSINVTFTPEKCRRKAVEGATLKVHYVGKLVATGKIFGSSFHTGSQPFRFKLGSEEVVKGWNDGLLDMCEGERRRLMVPWDMAYGEKGYKGVPPYSDLQVRQPAARRAPRARRAHTEPRVHRQLLPTLDQPCRHAAVRVRTPTPPLLTWQYDIELVELSMPVSYKETGKKKKGQRDEL